MLVSTTPNAICATATLAISDTLGSAAAIIVGTETDKPAIDVIPKVVIPSSLKTLVSKSQISGKETT